MPSHPRRVLMVCYYFPPILATGVTRSRSFAELLPRFGWTPRVLTVSTSRDPWVTRGSEVASGVAVERTPEWNLARLVDVSHAILVRVMRLFGVELETNTLRDLFCIPDTQIAWWSSLPGARLAREAEVVYVSCSPFSSAVSGVLIKRLSGKPLVVDFRDAWTLNPHTAPGRFHRAVSGALERLVLRNADRLIVNTEGAAQAYRRAYPAHADRIVAIPNGYDELTPVTAPRGAQGPFRIMHVGNFYGSRAPGLLLEALCQLPGLDIEFVQVGTDFPLLAKYRDRLRITVTGAVPRRQALDLMATASLLYLKQGWEPGVNDYIAVAAKTYEYLATGLPILAEVPPGDNAEIVGRYAGRSWLVLGQDVGELRKAVEEAYTRRAEPLPGVNGEFVARFDRVALAERLAGVLDEVTGGRHPPAEPLPGAARSPANSG